MRIPSLSLTQKLTCSFAVLVLAASALNGASYLHIERLDAAGREASAERTRAEAADALPALIAERRVALQDVAAGTGSEAGERLQRSGAAVRAALARVAEAETSDPTQLARLGRLDRLETEFAGQSAAVAAAAPADRAASLLAADADRAMMTLALGLRAEAAPVLASQAPSVAAGRVDLLLATLALAALALGVGVALARDLGRSLRRLSDASAALGEGRLDAAVPLTERRDEIGRVARSTEALRRSLLSAQTARTKADEANLEAASAASDAGDVLRREAGEREQAVEVLERALTRLSAGDLSARVHETLPGRYARLSDEFNKAAAHLGDMVGRVAGAVSSISNGTSEIGHAADDLSRRTEQQAASLDKTASALDEITATVKHSAENASSVAAAVANARGDTERSGEVMREAVEAMNAIQKSSQQIARIIGVIDEIAFQTNLLALNAGVEAARAGDAGRGFAVVALEVRALAQRSSEAAKEIKTLIGASSTQVGHGVDLVNRSGEVLTRIAAQVMQIDALVQEIAGSAREQSIGIAEVNDAVSKMDRVTQQNAAMVEETTAATLSLRGETEELGRLVAAFQVDGTDTAVRGLRDISAVMHAAESRPAARPAAQPARPGAAPAPVRAAAPVAAAAAAVAMAAPTAPAADEDLGWEEF